MTTATANTLIKWVACTASGNWVAMYDSQQAAANGVRNCLELGLHVEKWSYPVLRNGTHGTPNKEL